MNSFLFASISAYDSATGAVTSQPGELVIPVVMGVLGIISFVSLLWILNAGLNKMGEHFGVKASPRSGRNESLGSSRRVYDADTFSHDD